MQPPDRLRQLVGVGHVEHQRLVGDPVRRRVGVPVGGDHPGPEASQGDRQLPADLAGTQQQHRRARVGGAGGGTTSAVVSSSRPSVTPSVTAQG
ncbi:phosphoribosylglycinamide formyltransferase 2 domain protein [Mycobacterium intracellulare 1956]|uniref:Phosphoribosylglycinamide formyltransferase 2 domain protein n=1 Tax=Mycobacterium intracellulare 1956 TaxID=1299331 RepID=X8CAY8_MYCIT|nr:phosphoribosylglycinamide formyltransferase 2 domain protein [Mycobacterium intracellulare 1956]